MSGESDLRRLLASMKPRLLANEYVFCSWPGGHYGEHTGLEPLASFEEVEGLSLIIPRVKADGAALPYQGVFRCITLTVHSSLDAVGLTAAVAQCLTNAGLSANVVAAFHHDHVLVQADTAERALAALEELSCQFR